MNNQKSTTQNHLNAIRTVAAFSGLEIDAVVAEFEQRFAA